MDVYKVCIILCLIIVILIVFFSFKKNNGTEHLKSEEIIQNIGKIYNDDLMKAKNIEATSNLKGSSLNASSANISSLSTSSVSTGNVTASGDITGNNLTIKNNITATKDITALNNILANNFYPIKSVYITLDDRNPKDILGFGTWEIFPKDKMLVCSDSSRVINGNILTHHEGPDSPGNWLKTVWVKVWRRTA